MYSSDKVEESNFTTGFTALLSTISIFSLSASVLKVPEEGKPPLQIDDTVMESSLKLGMSEKYKDRKWKLQEKISTFHKKTPERYGEFHWIGKWPRGLSLVGTTSNSLQRRRPSAAVEALSDISMNQFLAEEAEEKELYSVTLYCPSIVLNRGSVHYTGGGMGLSLGIRSDGKVIVTAVNSIEERSESSKSIQQPSPAQIHGGISVGDCLLKINKISLQNLDFMQLTNILNRIEELLKDGVVLQFQYGQKDALKFIQDVSLASHAVGDMDSESANNPTHQKKNTPSNGHTNLFLANLFTENYAEDTLLSEESYLGTRLGHLQQFYDDFLNFQFSPKHVNQKLIFGDILQTAIRKSHTYPIAARTNSIAHNRSTDILLRELAAEVFEWRPRFLSSVYGGYFRSARYPLLIRTPTDKAYYQYTKVLVWDATLEKYVFSVEGSGDCSGGKAGVYESYRDVIQLAEVDEKEGNVSVSLTESEDDLDPFDIFHDVEEEEEEEVVIAASNGDQPHEYSASYRIVSKASEDFLALSDLMNERMLGCAGNSRAENRVCILSKSHSLQVFIDCLQDTTNDCDHILETLTHAVDVELALDKVDGDVPIQLTHSIFIALQLFPEAILASVAVERILLKWQLIIGPYINPPVSRNGPKSNGSKPTFFRRANALLDLDPFYPICSQLLTLLYSLWMCKDHLLLDYLRAYATSPDYLLSTLFSRPGTILSSKHSNPAADKPSPTTWDISKFEMLPIQISRQSSFNPSKVGQDNCSFQTLNIEEFINKFGCHLNLDMVLFICGVVSRKSVLDGRGDAIVRQLDCIQTAMRLNEQSGAASAVFTKYCASSDKIIRSVRKPGEHGEKVMKDIQEYSKSVSRKSRHSFVDTLRHLKSSVSSSSRSLVTANRGRKNSLKSNDDPNCNDGKQQQQQQQAVCIWLCACVFNLKEMFHLNEERTLEICVELSFLIDPTLVMYIFFHGVDMDSIVRQFQATALHKSTDTVVSSENCSDVSISTLQKYFRYLDAVWRSKQYLDDGLGPSNCDSVALAVDLLKVSLLLYSSHGEGHPPTAVSAVSPLLSITATTMRSSPIRQVKAVDLVEAARASVDYLVRLRFRCSTCTITSQILLCPFLADCVNTCARFNYMTSIWDLLCAWVDSVTGSEISVGDLKDQGKQSPFCWGSEKVQIIVSKVIHTLCNYNSSHSAYIVTVLDQVKNMLSSLRKTIHIVVKQTLQLETNFQGSLDLSGVLTSYWLLLLLRRLYEVACDNNSNLPLFDSISQLEEIYNSAIAVLKTDIVIFMDHNGNGDSSSIVAQALTVSLIDSLNLTGAIALLENLPCCANFLLSATFFSSISIE